MGRKKEKEREAPFDRAIDTAAAAVDESAVSECMNESAVGDRRILPEISAIIAPS